eukprot:CAMPEP_0172314932 /NCGR_PEP_ID=MMETSP1058-20130122/23575_1 /TAXON_ID=83371 /ORGANISM="Detonula confervacea, Strain CCMP 353" /LENGTH=136 /DNA_ID=CAMNT_0013028889 /DNA_START=33 /DNA_END=439 /DNA_ORIENTATION=+
MKSTSDKPSSSSGGADVSDSWSAAFIADYENNNDNIPPGDNEEKKMEVQVAIDTSPSKESSCSIPDLSSPKSSPFRQSLDEEHRAKSRIREMEAEKMDTSKQLLRNSIQSLSVRGGGGGGEDGDTNIHDQHSVLTR